MTSPTKISKEEENGIRLHLLAARCVDGLLQLFHQYFPSTPVELYDQLQCIQPKLLKLKNKRIITKIQWGILFPNDSRTNSKSFDISLLFLLIRHVCSLASPSYWENDPSPTDVSIEASVIRIKKIRNSLSHSNNLLIDDVTFTSMWSELSNALLVISPDKRDDITEVKNIALDLKIMDKLQMVESDLKKLDDVNNQLKNDIEKLKQNLSGVRWNVLPNVENFFGREEESKALHQKIVSADPDIYFGAAITGLGGVGKTELAKCYCNEYGVSSYDGNVIWMNAIDANTLESSFLKVAEFLDLSVKDAFGNTSSASAVVAKVYNFFHTRKSLFVFDNFTYFSDFIAYFPTTIPSGSIRPTILITTQYKRCDTNFVKMDLDVFSADCATKFINFNLKRQDANADDVKRLSDLTGSLPLALQQAMGYINRHSISIEKYIELFNKNSERLLSSKEEDVFYKQTVLTTWTMALDRLNEQNNKISKNIIFLMSYMNGKSIDRNIFLGMRITEFDLNDALDTLASYSLVCHAQKSDYIIMHSLVQLVVRQTAPIDSPSTLLELLQKQINVSLFDKSYFGDSWIEHILSVFNNSTMSKDLMDMFIKLRIYIKQALINNGKYTVWEKLFSSVLLDVKPFIYPRILYNIYDIRADIAIAMQYSGKYEDSKKELKNLITEQEEFRQGISHKNTQPSKTSSNHHIIVMRNKCNLARCLLYQGNYIECMSYLEDIKEGMTQYFGETHASLNTIDHMLALCLMKTGKYKKALAIFRDVEENVTELSSVNASVYNKRSNEESFKLKQDGLIPDYVTIRSCIAKSLFKLRKYSKSLKIFKEVETERESLLGSNHPLTLQDRCNTATCIAQKFQLSQGIEMLKEIEKQQKEIFAADDHPQVLVTQYNMAKTFLKRKKLNKALDMYTTLHKKQCAIFGEQHPRVLATNRDMEYCTTYSTWYRYCPCRSTQPFEKSPLFFEFS